MTRVPAFWLSFVLIVLQSGAPGGLAARYISPDWENRLALGLTFAAALLCLILLPLIGARRVRQSFAAAWSIVLFCLLGLASTAWSIAPAETLRDAVHCTTFVMVALTISSILDLRELMRVVAAATVFIGIVSLLTIPFGGLMTTEYVGALAGVFGEKNEMGGVLAVGIFAATVTALQRASAFWWIATIGLFVLLLMTQSGTALLAAMIGVTTVLTLEGLRRGPRRMFLGGWLSVVLAIFLAGVLYRLAPEVMDVTGRDMTLTGRSEIWPPVIDYINARPMTGYGYGAFWSEASVHREWLWQAAGFEAQNAHNTGLEALLSVGVPGFLLLSWFFLRTGAIGLWHLYGSSDPRRFALPFTLMIGVMSLTESILVGPDGFVWMVFVMIAARVALKPVAEATPVWVRRATF